MILCVTGPMAAGKNAVSDILEKKGYVSVDADKTVHQILLDKAIQKKILETFCKDAEKQNILLTDADGTLNRRNLGALLFSNRELLQKHEAIIHPEVNRLLEEFISANAGKNVIINATVLYKIPVIKKCSRILYVTAPFFTRLKRAKKRDGMKIIHILSRFYAQRKLFAKYKNANADIIIIRNTGGIAELESQINRLKEL